MSPIHPRWQCRTIGGLLLLPSRILLADHGGEVVILTPSMGYQFDGEFYQTLWDLPAGGRYRLITGPALPWHLYWRWRLYEGLPWERMLNRMVAQEGAYYRARKIPRVYYEYRRVAAGGTICR